MKKTLIILSICIMANFASFGQGKLRNGVYEFRNDVTEAPSYHRVLTIKDDITIYETETSYSIEKQKYEIFYLDLKKCSDTLYKAQNPEIELVITDLGDSDLIDVEILKIELREYSTNIPGTSMLTPEKRTLLFQRELTEDDEKKILHNPYKRKIGTEWSAYLDYDKDLEWKFSIKPSNGFIFSHQIEIWEDNKLTEGYDFEPYIEYRKGHIATEFVFIAKKIGKYKLTFDNGIKQHTFEVAVVE